MSIKTRIRFNDTKGGLHREYVMREFACPPQAGDTFVLRSSESSEHLHLCVVAPGRFFQRWGELVITCTLPAGVVPNDIAEVLTSPTQFDEDIVLALGYLL